MSEPALKCENNAIFNQSYTLKLLLAFKMAYSECLSLSGNLDFLEFILKSFITSLLESKIKINLYLPDLASGCSFVRAKGKSETKMINFIFLKQNMLKQIMLVLRL